MFARSCRAWGELFVYTCEVIHMTRPTWYIFFTAQEAEAWYAGADGTIIDSEDIVEVYVW